MPVQPPEMILGTLQGKKKGHTDLQARRDGLNRDIGLYIPGRDSRAADF